MDGERDREMSQYVIKHGLLVVALQMCTAQFFQCICRFETFYKKNVNSSSKSLKSLVRSKDTQLVLEVRGIFQTRITFYFVCLQKL